MSVDARVVALSVVLTIGAGLAFAETLPTEPTAAPGSLGGTLAGGEPIDVSADEASLHEAERMLVLTGNVIARQSDIELKADKVSVYYLEGAEASDGSGKIDRLIAEGNVVVTRPGEIVKSNAATYKMIEKQIIMTGNVIATRGNNVIRGEKVTVDLSREVIELQSDPGDGRVRALFAPGAAPSQPN